MTRSAAQVMTELIYKKRIKKKLGSLATYIKMLYHIKYILKGIGENDE